jgi:hypothetical protein
VPSACEKPCGVRQQTWFADNEGVRVLLKRLPPPPPHARKAKKTRRFLCARITRALDLGGPATSSLSFVAPGSVQRETSSLQASEILLKEATSCGRKLEHQKFLQDRFFEPATAETRIFVCVQEGVHETDWKYTIRSLCNLYVYIGPERWEIQYFFRKTFSEETTWDIKMKG